jgi:hypothetical protein
VSCRLFVDALRCGVHRRGYYVAALDAKQGRILAVRRAEPDASCDDYTRVRQFWGLLFNATSIPIVSIIGSGYDADTD